MTGSNNRVTDSAWAHVFLEELQQVHRETGNTVTGEEAEVKYSRVITMAYEQMRRALEAVKTQSAGVRVAFPAGEARKWAQCDGYALKKVPLMLGEWRKARPISKSWTKYEVHNFLSVYQSMVVEQLQNEDRNWHHQLVGAPKQMQAAAPYLTLTLSKDPWGDVEQLEMPAEMAEFDTYVQSGRRGGGLVRTPAAISALFRDDGSDADEAKVVPGPEGTQPVTPVDGDTGGNETRRAIGRESILLSPSDVRMLLKSRQQELYILACKFIFVVFDTSTKAVVEGYLSVKMGDVETRGSRRMWDFIVEALTRRACPPDALDSMQVVAQQMKAEMDVSAVVRCLQGWHNSHGGTTTVESLNSLLYHRGFGSAVVEKLTLPPASIAWDNTRTLKEWLLKLDALDQDGLGGRSAVNALLAERSPLVSTALAAVQKRTSVRCYECGEVGHRRTACPKLKGSQAGGGGTKAGGGYKVDMKCGSPGGEWQ